jgi:hypothetical protein
MRLFQTDALSPVYPLRGQIQMYNAATVAAPGISSNCYKLIGTISVVIVPQLITGAQVFCFI